MKTITLAVLLAASATAFAQPTDVKARAKAASDEAQQLYEAKDYARAAEKFIYAFNLDPDPTYHFNAAQAYRQGGDCQNAKVFYQKFKEESGKDMSAQDLDKINRYIKGEGCTDKPQTNPTNPPPPPNPPNPTPNPNPPNPNPPTPNPNTNTTAPIEPNPNPGHPSDTPHSSHAVAYGVGAVGIISGVVGIVFASRYYGDKHDRDEVITACGGKLAGCSPDNVSKLNNANNHGQTDSVVSIVASSVGVAAVGAAIWLYIRQPSETERTVSVGPTRSGAMVTAGWRF